MLFLFASSMTAYVDCAVSSCCWSDFLWSMLIHWEVYPLFLYWACCSCCDVFLAVTTSMWWLKQTFLLFQCSANWRMHEPCLMYLIVFAHPRITKRVRGHFVSMIYFLDQLGLWLLHQTIFSTWKTLNLHSHDAHAHTNRK